jgi:phosphinothricin acetyltransferase
MIRPAQISDAAAICSIYNHYVLQTSVTFEEEAVSEVEMADRVVEVTDSLPWLVLEQQGIVIGFAYASRWKSRCAYRYSVESTIYLDRSSTGRGLGRPLYEALLTEIGRLGRHSVIAGIALPNAASQGIHESLGFKKVAHFEEVGWKFDQWIDVGYWELIFPSVVSA